MGESVVPALPPGFSMDSPPLPAGFRLDTPQSSAIQAPQPTQPIAPHLIDVFKKGAASALSLGGMALDVAAAPGKLIQLGIHAISPSTASAPNFSQMTQQANAGWDQLLGVKNIPVPTNEYGQPSKTNEYLSTLANFAGANALPGFGVVSMAEKKLATALAEAAATAASATSSVELKSLAESWAPTFGVSPERAGQLGSIAGAMLGQGVATAVGKSAGAISDTTSNVLNKFGVTMNKDAQARATNALAVKQLDESLKANLSTPANLAESVDVSGKIPNFQPTLGQASNAPGVIAIQNRLATQNPAALAEAAARENQNALALQAYKEANFPAGQVAATAPVKAQLQKMQGAVTNNLSGAQENINALVAVPTVNQAEIGAQLRELGGQAKAAAQGVKNANYTSVYEAANKAGVKADISDIGPLIQQITGSDANAAQVMPALFNDFKSTIAKYAPEPAAGAPIARYVEGKLTMVPTKAAEAAGPVEVPFEALHSMLKRAGEDMTRAQMAGDSTKAYYIGQVRDNLAAKVAQFEGPQYGNVADKLKTANDYYKNSYVPSFVEGLGGRLARFNRFGDVTPDEAIVSKLIFNKDNRQGLSDFNRIYGGNPEATSILERGVTDLFGKAVVRDGEIKPALVETFMRDHPQLDQMPALKSALTNIDTANDALLARRQQIQQQQANLDQSLVAKIAKNDGAVGAALTDPAAMRVLATQASKTPQGSAALARAVADSVSQQKNPYEFLMTNQASLKPQLDKLGPNHFDNLVTLAKGEEIAGRTAAPTHISLERLQDIGEKTVGTPIKGLLSRGMNVAKGYMSPMYAAADVLGRYAYKVKTEDVNKILESAIYDPEMAKALIDMQKSPSAASAKNVANHALAHGIRFMAVANEKLNAPQSQNMMDTISP